MKNKLNVFVVFAFALATLSLVACEPFSANSNLSAQTAVSENRAAQTQVAAAPLQQAALQDRRQIEQMLVALFAGLALWGFWGLLRRQQINKRIREKAVAKAHELAHQNDVVQPESDVINSRLRSAEADDKASRRTP